MIVVQAGSPVEASSAAVITFTQKACWYCNDSQLGRHPAKSRAVRSAKPFEARRGHGRYRQFLKIKRQTSDGLRKIHNKNDAPFAAEPPDRLDVNDMPRKRMDMRQADQPCRRGDGREKFVRLDHGALRRELADDHAAVLQGQPGEDVGGKIILHQKNFIAGLKRDAMRQKVNPIGRAVAEMTSPAETSVNRQSIFNTVGHPENADASTQTA